MKLRLILGVAVVTAASAAAMSWVQPSRAQEADAMANTIEGKIARLERKVQALEAQVSLLQRNRSIVLAPPTTASINPQSTLPRGSKPSEFNGGTFYWVPTQKSNGKIIPAH